MIVVARPGVVGQRVDQRRELVAERGVARVQARPVQEARAEAGLLDGIAEDAPADDVGAGGRRWTSPLRQCPAA